GRLARLEEQNRQLLGQLAESQSQEDNTARKEREVMLRLKEVVDKQRDELRAQAHEIVCKSRDTEALQEQLHRFMAMNEDLRHKVAVVQAQLKSALERKADLEAVVLQTQREMNRRSRAPSEIQQPKPSLSCGLRSPSQGWAYHEMQLYVGCEQHCGFVWKTVALVHVPLALWGTLLGSGGTCGEPDSAQVFSSAPLCCSDEDDGSWLPARSTDCVDAQPPESKIRSFFGLWYQDSSKDSPTSSCSGAWEIIDSLDTQPKPEGENEPVDNSPDRAMPAL
ncbi:RIPL1 protein, partial [Columbina picui]|nr:RIPL1 protein [Columbina picui]